MDKEIAEEIIRENRYPSGYDIQDYLFDNEDTVLSLEDGTVLIRAAVLEKAMGATYVWDTEENALVLHYVSKELADAQDLKSCGTYTPIRVRFPLPAFGLSNKYV